MNNNMEEFKKEFKTIIIVATAVIVFVIIGLIINGRQGDNKESQTIADKTPVHNCAVGTFTKSVKRGEEVTFKVFLKASRFWPKYRVSLGDLPREVSAVVSDSDGRGDGEAEITLKVGPTAPTANYSLMIIYEEDKGGGDYSTNYCQYNLVIK